MIEVFIDKRFGLRQRIAIERHVHKPHVNVLPRKDALYYAGYREAHYPVPAIIYHVDSGRTGVAIWNNSKPYTDEDYYTMQPEFELNNPDYL